MGTSTRTMGIAVTDVDTSAKLPLGYEYHEPASNDNLGDKVWIYILADEALAVGDIVQVNPDWGSPFHGHKSDGGNTNSELIGVAQHAIASASYGFVLKRGYAAYIQGDGSVAAGESVMCHASTDGMADTWAAGSAAEEKIFGLAFTADAADTDYDSRVLFAGLINCGV